jgi:hypothetical protein
MNLERYVSSVYCETITDSDFIKKLDEAVAQIDSNETYLKLRTSYTEKYITYVYKEKEKDKIKQKEQKEQVNKNNKNNETTDRNVQENKNENEANTYILDKLFCDIVFGKNIGYLRKNKVRSIILFPVFKDIDSIKRLLPSIRSIYAPILEKKDPKNPFKRGGYEDNPSDNNVYFFVPAFSDSEESVEEYSTELKSYFTRAIEYILQEKQVMIGGVVQPKENRFENIIYTVDKNNQFFTSYYNKKLSLEKSKALDSIVVKFVEKLGTKVTKVKDPILSLTKEESIRKFKADGYGKYLNKLTPYFNLLELFLDIYKKTNDREYLKLTSSSDSQSFLKIYYRINNTDNVDIYDEIRPGSNYVYKISENNNPNSIKIGYFIEKQGLTNQYIFREYTGLTGAYKKNKKENLPLDMKDAEDAQEEDSKDTAIPKEYVIETRIIGNIIYYRRITREGNNKFTGKVKPIMNLHIYEKYKWFKFNDLSGELSSETKIKFYRNLLFDKESLIEFLKINNRYNNKIPIGVEFLKINQDNKLLVQYVDFLLTVKRDTHVFNSDDLFVGKQNSFVEKTKRSITEMLFQSNKLIYTTNAHSGQTKEDIKKNYKMISYEYYPVRDKDGLDKHFNKINGEDEEIKYCKKGYCKEIYDEISNQNIDFAIAIVDITKENIESIDALKKKTKCKKLRKTLRKQIQPYIEKMPQLGGRLRSRRRKNSHKR